MLFFPSIVTDLVSLSFIDSTNNSIPLFCFVLFCFSRRISFRLTVLWSCQRCVGRAFFSRLLPFRLLNQERRPALCSFFEDLQKEV